MGIGEGLIQRKLTLSVFVLVLLFAGCNKPHWQEFNSPDGHYSVTFPAPPTEEVKSVETPRGSVQVRQQLATLGSHAFITAYNDYAEPEDEIPAEQRLNGWRSSVMNGRTLISGRDLPNGQTPGMEIVLDTPEGLRMTARAYFRGRRLYQVMTATPKGREDPEETAHFLDSFKILPE